MDHTEISMNAGNWGPETDAQVRNAALQWLTCVTVRHG